jgi:cyclohexanecarboxylate-CoA ligase
VQEPFSSPIDGAPGSTLESLIDARARATPHHLLLVAEDGRRVTCDEFRERTRALASNLRQWGLTAGAVVSWVLPTDIDTLVLSAALSIVGVIQNPIIPNYREREISHIVDETNVDVIIVVSKWHGFDFQELANTISAARGGRPRALHVRDVLDGNVEAAGLGEARSHAHLGDARWIFYTSGSTGLPKGVRHNDATLAAVARGMVAHLMMSTEDRSGVAFPIAHIGGPINLMASLISGATMILIESFDPVRSSEVLARERVTMAGSGTAFHLAYLEVQRTRMDQPLFPDLRCCPGGGAPKPPGLHGTVKHELGGVGIVSGWGLTEAPVLTMGKPTDPDSKLSETEGTPLPGVRLRVVSADEEDLPPGSSGELRALGPQMMLGYVDSTLDVDVFDDRGFLKTGDLGSIDSDGHVRVTGRLKDVVIRNGENIGAAEVEELLRGHRDVLDVAVLGLPDANTGEKLCAVVEMAPDIPALDVRRIAEYLHRQGLRRNAWPEHVEIIRMMPRTAAGKIDKAQLKAQVLTKMASVPPLARGGA